MEELLSQLNPSQREAVEYIDGPSLVIAGAGSGKTRALTFKIAYLMKLGLPPQNILALTFTNKAAREMKERIARLMGEREARRLWMGTFHSIFSRILRAEAEKIGFQSNFTIADSADSRNLIKKIISEYQLDDKVYKPARIQAVISHAKNALLSPEMYAQNKELLEYDRKSKIPMAKDIFMDYRNRLIAANTMDFDDLLFYTNRLFRNHPDVLAGYQNRFQFILVDEYQDTNFAQHLIVKQLSEAHNRVCVVGDDAQSIYSFRGANISNILHFNRNYPHARIFKMEQNYRSTKTIVNAANSLISKNTEQYQKNVYSEREEGDKIELSGAFSDFEEGVIVSNRIFDLRQEKGYSYSDFVILYRTNAQSRIFEEALRKKNIPYRIYGGLSFYQRKEIKDVIAYFRLIVNPHDEVAFERIINYPARGIGQTTQNKIIAAARLHHVSLWDVIGNPIAYNLDVNSGTANKLRNFRQMMEGFIGQQNLLSAYDLASAVVKQAGIAGDAYQDQTPEGMSRQENLQELISGIHEFTEMRREEGGEQAGLLDFLAEVSLLSDQDTDKEADTEKVTMMTVHASKGLEFKNVFIVGLEEDLFPSSLAKLESGGLEEERRLFYVAITRAEEFCMLTYAKSRFRNGQTNACNPSRFLREIDVHYLQTNERIEADASGERFNTHTRGGFWDTVRQNREQRETFPARTANRQESPKPTTVPANFVRVKDRESSPSLPEKGELAVGSVMRHERFGRGTVIALEGEANSRKATVEFDNAGVKQLLLKFARYEVIG
ncbi:MAG: UvrD-helicase domain-containing protein [Prevotella sp.]|jgi:DNA helicase-2/ATP-dependent DNA helicase PcrA|nr:UvrD-helicase domain-containing protein [Prevotella sp.]